MVPFNAVRYIQKLFGQPVRRRIRQNSMTVEALETRVVPAYISGGSLVVDGTNYADTVTVTDYPTVYQVNENGWVQNFPRTQVTTGQFHFRGNGGNDTFSASTRSLQIVAHGGAGNDMISGGARGDILAGEGGDDKIYGQEGDDQIYGNDGNDSVWAGDGNDSVFGGWGNDILAGEAHNDYIRGEGGSDQIYGNDGNDTLYGDNAGNLWGGEAADSLFGGWGNDVLAGEGGDDYLRGEGGSDQIYGNDGNDKLCGDNDGNPWGGEMADSLFGGWGNDTLKGEGGNDGLYGEGGDDILYGGSQNDKLYGGANWDWLYGENDNDWLEAGSAAEFADGGNGTDYNAHVWTVNGTTATDVKQQQSNLCVFLAALAGTSKYRNLDSNISYEGNNTYAVRMFDRDADHEVTIRVPFDGTLVMDTAGNTMDPTPAAEGEFWTILYQRAYLKYFRGVDPMNGNAVKATGGESDGRAMSILIADDVYDDSIKASWFLDTDVRPSWLADVARTQLVCAGGTGHRYMVDAVFADTNGNWSVRLYNPWGNDASHNGMAIVPDGTDDGFITISWGTFQDKLKTVWYT